ncbi:MAG TPA: DinB family protein [Gemmatimonadales bacterium]|nr:DinB family protein [Gemmatimonadales bacterium]
MTTPTRPEAWLRGPIPGIDPRLMPAAHALIQAAEDLERAALGLTPAELWRTPAGAASVGFHLKHIAGSITRLLAYARGERLTPEQLQAIALEREPGDPPSGAPELVRRARESIDRAIDALRHTDPATLFDARAIGRQALPTNVLGLLFHLAEHTQRHTGQVITTAKIVRGTPAGA